MARLEDIFENVSGKDLVLLGNEAIARGIVEAGVAGVFTYPGTPSSEIPNTLHAAQPILKKIGYELYLEWSTNEAVALEAAYGFSLLGHRSIFVCKHVGLNVAADPFMTLVNAGVIGGLVLIVAEDPNMHSSQNEQDNRWYTKISNAPMFEPSDAREAKSMIIDAFRVSEKYQVPVILRTLTRISHSRVDVPLDPIIFPEFRQTIAIEIDPRRFVCVPSTARQNKQRMLQIVKDISNYLAESPWNRVEMGTDHKFAFIACGSAYIYLKEVLHKLGLNYPILKLGVSHPFPKKKVSQFLKQCSTSTIVVVEEADDVLETFVKKLAFETGFQNKIIGRREGITPSYGELTVRKLWNGFLNGMEITRPPEEATQKSSEVELIFSRPPVLCPGCPHRATFFALNKAVPRRHRLVSTDIGCYTLGVAPPLSAGHVCICMGSSLGIASGLTHSPGLKDPVVSIIGDSTFWHTGLPGLANAVYNKSNLMLLVVDNSATAMTGFQPNPSSFVSHSSIQSLAIEDAVRGLGVEFMATIDAYNPKESIKIMKEAINHEGVSVIVSKGECVIQYNRREGLPKDTYYIETDRCVGCYACVHMIACPAIMWSDRITTEEGKPVPVIDQSLCTRCGLCKEVCPYNVIVKRDAEEVIGE
ncbi:MAG: indolepyruvate ferredoxin oxidoreductase subunit alpha [Candidatus Heimdallarchaeota archaeon]|nr:MAG: indolepyruvate ferredoxin oxidoreductase subunit alpha [Candidatus Heimdallarchaeota archaeon]